MPNKIEILFSFDTTGSMYPCLTQVRKNVKTTVKRLFKELPDIRIGIVAHGDYCDEKTTYLTSHFPISDDADAICRFVENVKPTGGGDAPEAYERVLKEAQAVNWGSDGASRALVMIGDELPHSPKETPDNTDWNVELGKLKDQGIVVYGVQCLNRSHAKKFYAKLADETGGYHITLDQFAQVTDMILAVCFQRAAPERLAEFEEEVRAEGRMSRANKKMFDTMFRREPAPITESDLNVVPPGRFQILSIDKDCSIKDFVAENGLSFKVGRGFYEFTKVETIQAKKQVVLMDKASGDLFAGEKARELLGLTEGENARLRPTSLEKYAVFVQSTSANRKLMGKTRFLYEVEDFSST